MLLLKRSLGITVFAAGIAALSGACGGLRALPVGSNDAAVGGASGSSAGVAGRGGSAGGTTGIGGSPIGVGGNGGSTTIIDGGNVDTPMCIAGGACVPANPCHKGMFVCNEGGAMVCMELTDLQANGTTCDADKVCHNGTCDACVQGMACDVTGRPCRVGSIACTTGAPVCTETDNKPNGTTCGTAMVCQAGSCATCQMGGACTPTNKCHTGTLVCSGASPSCTDTNTNVAAGMSCGTDMVCDGRGACAACMQGMDCAVPGKPCRKGTIACNTGAPVCIESSDVPNGTVCGAGMVCSAGACAACSAGTACVPANPCHAGITVCAPTIGCTDTGNPLANGAGCGTDRVCNAGNCVACAAGASCQPMNVCKTGTVSCATGSPVCSETGNRPNGMSCGANMVCSAGSCTTCMMSASCIPTNPCHTGTLNCSTGTPACTDSGANQTDGTSCGPNLVCKTGMCVSCTAGQPCQPTNPCKTGVTSCATGASVCVESGDKGAGTLCGAGQSCANGVLTLPAMCNAASMCVAATMNCTNGCNTAGTDCVNCPTGQTSCPAGCRDLTRDATNCGMCGNACRAPQPAGSGIPICASSSCGINCNPGFMACDPPSLAMCQPLVFDFEDQTVQGFQVLNSPSAAGKPGITPSPVHGGRVAFGALIKATATARGFQIGPLICAQRGFIPAKGLTVTGWMYLEPSTDTPPLLNKAAYFGLRVTTESGDTLVKAIPKGYKEWFPISVPIPAGETRLLGFNLEGVFATDALADWSGNVYIDDVTIQ